VIPKNESLHITSTNAGSGSNFRGGAAISEVITQSLLPRNTLLQLSI